jgi:hypothetical protein
VALEGLTEALAGFRVSAEYAVQFATLKEKWERRI